MKWLSRTLITSPYHYGLCRSEKEFHRQLKRLGLPRRDWSAFLGADSEGASTSADATTHFFENKKRFGLAAIVCIGNTRGSTRAQIHALLAHEAMHIWRAIRENIGETKPSHEFEAYALQAITQNLITAFGEKP